jgi:hypothetical protein
MATGVRILIPVVGFEVLTAASMKMGVFWVVAPCSLVEVYRHFRDTGCLQYRPDDGGSKYLLNVNEPDYTALQPGGHLP